MIPNDPAMLLSYVNMQLRDFYPSLEELVKGLDLDREELIKKMSEIDYEYDSSLNQFV